MKEIIEFYKKIALIIIGIVFLSFLWHCGFKLSELILKSF